MIKVEYEDVFIRIRLRNFTFGKKIAKRQIGFKELEEYTLKNGEPKVQSSQQELLENMLNEYI